MYLNFSEEKSWILYQNFFSLNNEGYHIIKLKICNRSEILIQVWHQVTIFFDELQIFQVSSRVQQFFVLFKSSGLPINSLLAENMLSFNSRCDICSKIYNTRISYQINDRW